MIECRTMASAERYDAYALMRRFRGDESALGEALTLFVERPDYGFIWLAYEDDHPAACASVSLGIDTEFGGVVATVRDFYVVPDRRRRGIGSALLLTLHGKLTQLDVARVDLVGAEASLLPFMHARGYTLAGAQFSRVTQEPRITR
jgi:GNAT superfamily N-acetyltransferase